jgi:hypothetical protein
MDAFKSVQHTRNCFNIDEGNLSHSMVGYFDVQAQQVGQSVKEGQGKLWFETSSPLSSSGSREQ